MWESARLEAKGCEGKSSLACYICIVQALQGGIYSSTGHRRLTPSAHQGPGRQQLQPSQRARQGQALLLFEALPSSNRSSSQMEGGASAQGQHAAGSAPIRRIRSATGQTQDLATTKLVGGARTINQVRWMLLPLTSGTGAHCAICSLAPR